ncbi:MAG: DMT family transporter [Planctomycetes bacterium]|nr:DMT family transporter [Planctomycetota bacterium]
MPLETLGSLFALGAASAWAGSILGFSRVIASHGAFLGNLFKATLGAALFALTAWVTGEFGQAAPGGRTVLLLVVSGLAGMAFGDYALFASIREIGPKRANLLHATNPIMLTLWAVFVQGSQLAFNTLLGIAMVTLGTLYVIASGRKGTATEHRVTTAGVLWGLGAGLGQASGLLLSSQAIQDCPLYVASGLRLGGASLGMIFLCLMTGRAAILPELTRPSLLRAALVPTLIGTWLAVSMMMKAIQLGHPAIVGALLATTPIILVTLLVLTRREPFRWGQAIAVVVAVRGVILISLGR